MKKLKDKKGFFQSAMWDYYKTNREITRYFDEEEKKARDEAAAAGEKRKWSKNEITYAAVTVVGLILIFVKYVILR
ncbi:MAG: hypothetical protein K6F52_06045 [Clostridia bacterium]|nr:hypothetical protein [Clostridia bacterium]